MKKELSSVRKLLGSADRATVESGVELVKALSLTELNEKLVEGLLVEPISNGSDAFGRKNLCAVSADSKAEVVKRVKAPYRGFVTLSLLKLAGKLDKCEGFTMNPYSQSKNLETGFAEISDASALNGLPNLESLDLAKLPVTGISDLPSLRAIKTSHAISPEVSLSSFIRLEIFEGSDYLGTELTTLDPPNSLQKLVFNRGCRSLVNLAGLERLPSLKLLKLGNCSQLISFDGINHCSDLREVHIESAQCSNLDPFAALSHLETLYLIRCRSIESIDGVLGLSTLQTLEISGTSAFESLQPFANLTNLSRLKLGRTPTLVSLAGAEKLPKLILFSAYECDALANIASLISDRDPDKTFSIKDGKEVIPDFGSLNVDLTRCTSLPEPLRFSFPGYKFNRLQDLAQEHAS